jgi:hypothetical protein
MPQSQGSAIYNSFVKGLITDSSNLNSDVNTIKEGVNFVLTRRGTLEKRLGLAIKSTFDVGHTPSFIKTEEFVTFDGKTWMYTYSPLEGRLQLLEANTKQSYYSSIIGSDVSFSFNDRFFVISKTWSDIKTLEWNGTSWVNLGDVEVKVRDFEGVSDGLGNEERPSSLDDLHRYNLENQGWGARFDDINKFKSDSGFYPSNADIAHLGVYENPNNKGAKEFKTSYITGTYLGSGLAPRGSKVLSTRDQYPRRFNDYTDCVNYTVQECATYSTDENGVEFCTSYETKQYQDCTTVQGATLTTNPYPYGTPDIPVCTAFFAGRVFYGAKNNVMFSQIVGTTNKNFGECYSTADPTSEEISDIIDTDGGMIVISGASGIFKLVEFSDTLLVFAKNGIWAISGSDASFTATHYSVSKISDYTAVSKEAILALPGTVTFLSTAGIMTTSKDKVTLMGTVDNLSKGRVQEYYNKFSREELEVADLKFSKKEEVLYIRFGNEVLALDSTLAAYYKLEIPTGCVGMLYQDDTAVVVSESNIVHETNQVVDGGEDVVVSLDTTISVIPQIRFLYNNGNSLEEYSMENTSYKDFGTDNYDAYFVTSNLMFDTPMSKKRIPQLSCWFEKTETGYSENVEGGLEYVNPSQCSFQIGWDMPLPTSFSSDPRNKWSREYSAYRLSRYESKSLGEVPGEALDSIFTRTSIRGQGRTIMIRFSSEPGYDCRLLGWNIDLTQTTRSK